MNGLEIDINCDMGESYGRFITGNDALIFPYVSSCNIACGFHAGDPLHIENTIKGALDHDVQIGAHPSYPDLQGFGRRKIKMEKAALKAAIKYQLCALKGMVESLGGALCYVKPHGALYNEIASDKTEALTVIEAIMEVDPTLALMGLAGSKLEGIAAQSGIAFIPEAFADRRYMANGSLMPRSEEGAVIRNPERTARQVLDIVLHQKTETPDGNFINIRARSICVHGDNEAAVDILQVLNKNLEAHHIIKQKVKCS